MRLLFFSAILFLFAVVQQGQIPQIETASSSSSILDFLYKISMPSIALFNFIFLVMIHCQKRASDKNKDLEARQSRERDLRIDYLKTIVYERNLPNFNFL